MIGDYEEWQGMAYRMKDERDKALDAYDAEVIGRREEVAKLLVELGKVRSEASRWEQVANNLEAASGELGIARLRLEEVGKMIEYYREFIGGTKCAFMWNKFRAAFEKYQQGQDQ